MHAVSSRSREGSRRSSIVPPETIQEDETSQAASTDTANDDKKEGGGRKMTFGDLGTGMPTSTRFVGKMLKDAATRQRYSSRTLRRCSKVATVVYFLH
jgi:hypothetical protein